MVKPTPSSRLLVAISAAQLATGLAGMVVALLRRRPYDLLWMHGRADTIARDTILKGTALSAPVSNLLVQAAVTLLVARRPSRGAARALGALGALQVAGYLSERLVRRRLRPSGWNGVESPLAAAGTAPWPRRMRVSFSVDIGRIEWPHAPTADPCDHHLALDVMGCLLPPAGSSLLGSAAAGHDEPG